ncbi:MAG TPA: hypothetical protein VIC82_00530 [Candidatus Nanopelagicales bacterium]
MRTTITRRLLDVATAGTALVAALALAGCGSAGPAATPTQPAAAATSSTPAPSATTSPVDLVAQVGLTDTDLANGYTVKLMDGGDQVGGQVTLDNCGYDFTTEAHRVARRQVILLTAQGQPAGASNEVVAYDSPDSAAQALTQFRTSVTGCPKGTFEKSTVAGVPDRRYDVSTVTASASLPVKDNAVATLDVSAKGSNEKLFVVLIFQRKGAVLDGTYLQMTTKPTAVDVAAVTQLATISGKRLAAA